MANTHSAEFVKASSQYASIASALGIAAGTISIEAWIYVQVLPPNGTEIAFWGWQKAANSLRCWLGLSNTAGVYTLRTNRQKENITNNNAQGTFSIVVNTWYHTAMTYDGTTLKLYTAPIGGTHSLLGSVAVSGNGASGVASDIFGIGGLIATDGYQTGAYADADIDDVRVWNTARSTAQLDANFQTELVGNESGLIAYYKVNSDFNDTTASAFHMTGSGSPSFVTNRPFDVSTTYNQTVAAIGAGAAAVKKAITSSAAVLHAIGAGVANVKKGITSSAATLHAIGAGVAAVKKGITMSITTLHAIGAGTAAVAASRAFLKTIAAVGVGAATVSQKFIYGKVLAATGAGTAALARTVHLSKTLAATGVGIAVTTVTRGIVLRAYGVGHAAINQHIGKTLAAMASASALLRKDFWKVKYPARGDDYDVKYPHGR